MSTLESFVLIITRTFIDNGLPYEETEYVFDCVDRDGGKCAWGKCGQWMPKGVKNSKNLF